MRMAPEAAEPIDEALQLRQQLRQIITEQHPEPTYHWDIVERPAKHFAVAQNVREYNVVHALRIGISMATKGQLQECVGCKKEGRDTIYAGLHRHAGRLEENLIEEELGRAVTNLRARIRRETFTKEEALAIQIAENLHEAMRPEEKAKAIVAVWKVYHDSAPEGEISMAKFANMIGRGVSEVSRAIRFATLDPRAQKLVEMDAVTYSLAVDLARLPQDKQFPLVNKIILANFDAAQIKRAMKEASGEASDLPGMFAPEVELELAVQHFRLGLTGAADRAARDAAGYFERVLHLLPLTDPKDRERVSDVVKDILVRLINSSDQFRDLLEKQDEWLFRELQTRELLMLPQAKKEAAVNRFIVETDFPDVVEITRKRLTRPERIRRDLGRKKLNEQFTELSLDEKYIVVMAQRKLAVNGGSGEKAAIGVDGRYHAIMDGLCEKGLFYKRYGEYLPAWVRF